MGREGKGREEMAPDARGVTRQHNRAASESDVGRAHWRPPVSEQGNGQHCRSGGTIRIGKPRRLEREMTASQICSSQARHKYVQGRGDIFERHAAAASICHVPFAT